MDCVNPISLHDQNNMINIFDSRSITYIIRQNEFPLVLFLWKKGGGGGNWFQNATYSSGVPKNAPLSQNKFFGIPAKFWRKCKPWIFNQFWCKTKLDLFVQFLQFLKNYLTMSVPEKRVMGQRHVFLGHPIYSSWD